MKITNLTDVGVLQREVIGKVDVKIEALQKKEEAAKEKLIQLEVIDVLNTDLTKVIYENGYIKIYPEGDNFSKSTVYVNTSWDGKTNINWSVGSEYGCSLDDDYDLKFDTHVEIINIIASIKCNLESVIHRWAKIKDEYDVEISALYKERSELTEELNDLISHVHNQNNEWILKAAVKGIDMPSDPKRRNWVYSKSDSSVLYIDSFKLIKESPKTLIIETTHSFEGWGGKDPFINVEKVRVRKDDFLTAVANSLLKEN